MKTCPQCSRQETNEEYVICIDCGADLVDVYPNRTPREQVEIALKLADEQIKAKDALLEEYLDQIKIKDILLEEYRNWSERLRSENAQLKRDNMDLIEQINKRGGK